MASTNSCTFCTDKLCTTCANDLKSLRDARAWLEKGEGCMTSVALLNLLLLGKGGTPHFAHFFFPTSDNLSHCRSMLKACSTLATLDHVPKLAQQLDANLKCNTDIKVLDKYRPRWDAALVNLMIDGFTTSIENSGTTIGKEEEDVPSPLVMKKADTVVTPQQFAYDFAKYGQKSDLLDEAKLQVRKEGMELLLLRGSTTGYLIGQYLYSPNTSKPDVMIYTCDVRAGDTISLIQVCKTPLNWIVIFNGSFFCMTNPPAN